MRAPHKKKTNHNDHQSSRISCTQNGSVCLGLNDHIRIDSNSFLRQTRFLNHSILATACCLLTSFSLFLLLLLLLFRALDSVQSQFKLRVHYQKVPSSMYKLVCVECVAVGSVGSLSCAVFYDSFAYYNKTTQIPRLVVPHSHISTHRAQPIHEYTTSSTPKYTSLAIVKCKSSEQTEALVHIYSRF